MPALIDAVCEKEGFRAGYAASVYSAVGFGGSVQEPFSRGKAALSLKGIPEEINLSLLTRNRTDLAQVALLASQRKIKRFPK